MHERSHTFRLSVTKIKLSILFSAPLMGNPLGRGADDHCGTWKKKKEEKDNDVKSPLPDDKG